MHFLLGIAETNAEQVPGPLPTTTGFSSPPMQPPKNSTKNPCRVGNSGLKWGKVGDL
jgi:hypothetical protein